jgi:hypothetical protein
MRNIGRIAGDSQGIIEGTWTYFDMNEPGDALRIDGAPLRYWVSAENSEQADFVKLNVGYNTPDLLAKAGGSCGGWAQFFLDVLAVNGVFANGDDGILKITSPIEKEELVIKNVLLQPGTSTNVKYPYRDGGLETNLLTETITALPSEVEDVRGISAQHNADPTSRFDNHALVRIGATLFDPGYGARYSRLTDWEDAALAGFSITVSALRRFTTVKIVEKAFREQVYGQPDQPDVRAELLTVPYTKYTVLPFMQDVRSPQPSVALAGSSNSRHISNSVVEPRGQEIDSGVRALGLLALSLLDPGTAKQAMVRPFSIEEKYETLPFASGADLPIDAITNDLYGFRKKDVNSGSYLGKDVSVEREYIFGTLEQDFRRLGIGDTCS